MFSYNNCEILVIGLCVCHCVSVCKTLIQASVNSSTGLGHLNGALLHQTTFLDPFTGSVRPWAINPAERKVQLPENIELCMLPALCMVTGFGALL